MAHLSGVLVPDPMQDLWMENPVARKALIDLCDTSLELQILADGLSRVTDEFSSEMISYGPVYLHSKACRVPTVVCCITCLRTKSPTWY